MAINKQRGKLLLAVVIRSSVWLLMIWSVVSAYLILIVTKTARS